MAVSSGATDLHSLQAALAAGNLDVLQSLGQLQHSLQHGGASAIDYNALALTGLPAIDPSGAGAISIPFIALDGSDSCVASAL